MSNFIFRGCFSKKGRKQELNNFVNIELADREGNKCISSNRSPNDNIPVKLNPETAQYWRIERSASDALWSFHILSDHKKKMYVTYNDSNNDVTLEYEDDIKHNNGMRRYFTMLLQPELGLLLRAENAYDRYLGKNNEILEMVKTDTPSYDLHWLIASSSEMINAVIEPFKVQIHQLSSSQKWMSEGAQINTPIQAQQLSSDQEWFISKGDNHTIGFSVESFKANDLLTFSEVGTSFLIHTFGSGVYLQCTSNSQYVSAPPDNGDLLFVPIKEMASQWDVEIMKVLLRKDDDSIIFPALSPRARK
ncbi:uncharacterized protein LOC120331751 [Styela clava]